MSQKHKNRFLPMALVAIVFSASAMFGQSLGDVARQNRAKEAKEKPAKVYTDDDVLPDPDDSSPPPAKESDKTPAADASAKDNKGSETKEGQSKDTKDGKASADGKDGSDKAPEKSQADLEKEYRERFAKLRDVLAFEEKKLDVLQREWNLMQEQYYSNPNVELREELFRDKINQQTADIEKEKAAVAKAEQAVADLEEELRKKGLPPGWARESDTNPS